MDKDAGTLRARLGLDAGPFVEGMKNAQKKMQAGLASMSKSLDSAGKGWWQTYGRVALGFTVAYRAMNLFEHGLQSLTQSFMEAAKESGELAAYQAKLTMFYRIASGTTESFAESYSKARGNILALTKAYKDSITPLGDLTTGMDELAQAGVIVTKEMTPAFISLISYTKLVAQTTGSTMRQVRQEFQALAEGRIRTTDILARSLKRLHILSQEDIKNLRDQVKTQEILEKVATEIHTRWSEIKDILISSDVTTAMEYWNKNLRYISIQSILIASSLDKSQNIFAVIFKEHAENFEKVFKTKDLARYVILVQDLAKVLDWALSALERFLKRMLSAYVIFKNFVTRVSEIIEESDRLKKSLTFLYKAFSTLVIARFVGFVLKELGTVAAWLVVGPLKTLYQLLKSIYGRFVLIPAAIAASITIGLSSLNALRKALTEFKDMFFTALDHIKNSFRVTMSEIQYWWFSTMEKLRLADAEDVLLSKAELDKNQKAFDESAEKLIGSGKDFGAKLKKEFIDSLKGVGDVAVSVVKDVLLPAIQYMKEQFPDLDLPGNYEEVLKQLEEMMKNIPGLEDTGLGSRPKDVELKDSHFERAERLRIKLLKESGETRTEIIRKEAELEYAIRASMINRMKITEDHKTELLKLAEQARDQQLKTIHGTFKDGMLQGLKEIRDGFKTTFEFAADMVKKSADSMRSFLSDGFFSMIKLDLDSLADAWQSFTSSIQRMIADMLAEQAMLALFSPKTGIFKSIGAMMGMKATVAKAGGGWIPEPVFGTGLYSGHNYAFAERGPERLTSSEASGGGGIINLTIQAVDARSFTDLVKRNPGAITGVFTNEMRSGNRSLRGSIRSVR
jgi:hypothetical protein